MRNSRLATIAAILVLTLTIVQAWSEDWVKFVSPAGYSVEFPGQWESKIIVQGPRDIRLTTLQKGDELAYVVVDTVISIDGGPMVTDVERFLSASRDGAVAQSKGKLRGEKQITISSLPAREIVIDFSDGDVTVERIVKSDNVIITANVTGHAGVENDPTTIRMLESLTVAGH